MTEPQTVVRLSDNLDQPIVYTVTEIAQTGYEFVSVSDDYDWTETGTACTGDFVVYSDNTVNREVTVTFTNKQSENDGYHSEGNIVNELGPDANQAEPQKARIQKLQKEQNRRTSSIHRRNPQLFREHITVAFVTDDIQPPLRLF